ncbi:hypothetical protein [Peptostreptococcus equinus]|uniref:Lipoprotein n=1 Tax=Peptostreptococcus equinus TaxID=3003601 RepID=A0ABY7JQY4_9FIRM|nr:hypothetical protein [Peptostreptococcus sp. CBA3647]WAW15559.1 hypothetical protein O0R46_03700 [Peptostreptococcus sp. CBA3647]
MNILKKSMLGILATSLALSTAACTSQKKDTTNNTTTTSKTEYITDINKDNVDKIIVEYKQTLSYYNDLKSNLKTISDVNKNSNLESDLASAKESITTNAGLVKDAKVTYKPLADAKQNLSDMYDLSSKMADTVIKDKNSYEKNVSEYNVKFKEFKKQMDQIRQDIEKVRGKNSTDTEDTTKEDKNNESNNKNDSSNKSNSDKESSTSKKERSTDIESKKNQATAKESGSTVIPFVSSLNTSLKNDIASAGAREGEQFKNAGGSKAEARAKASELFDGFENDSPIQSSERSEAKQIFIEAFMNAYSK